MIAAFCIGEETQNFFAVSLSHNLRFTGVQGRFLASLEMTIRGQPSTRRDERECEIVRLLVSSSKAELRGLNVIAAFCIGEETQNFFAVSLSHNLRFTGVQGRFLASLEMTIRGQPSTRRDERGCEIARPPVSSSKAEPRDLNVIAAFCIGEETQKFFCRIVISQSLLYRCARKISRFARNDDRGKGDDMGEARIHANRFSSISTYFFFPVI